MEKEAVVSENGRHAFLIGVDALVSAAGKFADLPSATNSGSAWSGSFPI